MDSSLKIETVRYCDRIADLRYIRTEVFQNEQGIASDLEFDGLDDDAIHLLAYLNGEAVATARLREIDRSSVKIERLAVLPEFRKRGIALQLMQSALCLASKQNKKSAVVHAQAYIAPLYKNLGFQTVGDKFSEADIPHVKMVKQLSPVN